MLGWLKKRREPRPIPQALWDDVLARYAFLRERPAADLESLRQLAARFLQQKQFAGAGGFVITDPVALAIAAQAVLPVLHLGLSWYDDFVGVVVHADEVVAERTVVDEDGIVHHYDEVLSGEAMDGGPVMLSWRDVEQAGNTAHEGYNVVIHEFIHKIDMRDGAADGCPPLRSRAARVQWLGVMQPAFDEFRERVVIAERFGGQEPWLDPYGARAIDEFFAVAGEAYFVNRQRFQAEFPQLVALFDGFFAAKDAAAR